MGDGQYLTAEVVLDNDTGVDDVDRDDDEGEEETGGGEGEQQEAHHCPLVGHVVDQGHHHQNVAHDAEQVNGAYQHPGHHVQHLVNHRRLPKLGSLVRAVGVLRNIVRVIHSKATNIKIVVLFLFFCFFLFLKLFGKIISLALFAFEI